MRPSVRNSVRRDQQLVADQSPGLLESIAHDATALMRYSHRLLQQQEYREACQVGRRCLAVFREQMEAQELMGRQQRRQWNVVTQDLYGGAADAPDMFAMQPRAVNPGIPGLWYIEQHLANIYHLLGQPQTALYHIDRTLKQLGFYQIDPDDLTVRLNVHSKPRPLSTYLVENALRTQQEQRSRDAVARQSRFGRVRSFMANADRALIGRGVDQKSEDIDWVNEPDDGAAAGKLDISKLAGEQTTIKRRGIKRKHINEVDEDAVRAGAASIRAPLGGDEASSSSSPIRAFSADDAVPKKGGKGGRGSREQNDESATPKKKRRRRSFMSKLVAKLSPIARKTKNKKRGNEKKESNDRMSVDGGSTHSNRAVRQQMEMQSADDVSLDDVDNSLNSKLSICENEDVSSDNESFESFKLLDEVDIDSELPPEFKMSDDADNVTVDDDEVDLHFFRNEANGTRGAAAAAAAASANVDFDNDPRSVIKLEALLGMYMTKGRILTELGSLNEAQDLYSYVIGEIESLVEYHKLVNPDDYKMEMEYDNGQRLLREYQERLRLSQQNGFGGGGNGLPIGGMGSGPSLGGRGGILSRRRNTRRDSGNGMAMMVTGGRFGGGGGGGVEPLPVVPPMPFHTPYHRLVKNLGR